MFRILNVSLDKIQDSGHCSCMKSILPSIIFVLICNLALADGHEDCAMMKGDAIDPEEFSEI